MELFREDGCMTDAGFRAMMDGQLDELGRLEAAEHLSYCDQCMDRYTALLTADALEKPPRSVQGAVMGTIWARLMQNTYGRAAVAGVAAVLALTLWRSGALFLCYFFVPHFNWELAMKIAPAAGLILLGCEVLYFAARPQRWKYDFLSVLLCIVLMVSAFGGACLMAAFDFALHREEFWIEYDARQERDLDDDESDRLRLDLDEGTGPDLDEENEDSSAASHTEV